MTPGNSSDVALAGQPEDWNDFYYWTGLFTLLAGVAAVAWLVVSRRRQQLAKLRHATRLLTEEEIVELQVRAPAMREVDLRRLFIRFMNLDWDRSGTITCNEFCSMAEMRTNPLSYRIFDAFDLNEDGHLDFAEFIGCVHVMSPDGSTSEKAAGKWMPLPTPPLPQQQDMVENTFCVWSTSLFFAPLPSQHTMQPCSGFMT